ncbi:MAG: tRNA pseudouridine(55) synthase TruB [Gammaproteobacteria bacterium]|nr:tRNA pseudouridine(55) synthase TruB [Gammaproteobacteria bacterium]
MTPAGRGKRDVSGLLLLDKPPGMTSNAALQRVRRLFAARKAGHTGSLDPIATGMLPLCLGEATKLSAFLLKAEKTYRVTARFGTRTDTGDAAGKAIAETAQRPRDRSQLEAVLSRFVGETEQVPPMYSALKHKGRRLYELARAGQTVERAPRRIRIRLFELEEYSPVEAVFLVACGGGVYVRTLIEDVAEAAGSLAHVSALRRLGVAPFEESGMVTMDRVEAVAAEGFSGLDALLLPADAAVPSLPAVRLSASESFHLQRGNPVAAARGTRPGPVRLYANAQGFIGIGEATIDGQVAPRRLLKPRSEHLRGSE